MKELRWSEPNEGASPAPGEAATAESFLNSARALRALMIRASRAALAKSTDRLTGGSLQEQADRLRRDLDGGVRLHLDDDIGAKTGAKRLGRDDEESEAGETHFQALRIEQTMRPSPSGS
ncbi:hypothetical protein CH337_12700, partial [Rhodoblastus acidophilus]